MSSADAFIEVIRATYSEDDHPRTEAEAMLKQVVKAPDEAASYFMHAITECEDEQVRQQACTLFRRLSSDDTRLWLKISDEIKEACKKAVIGQLMVEQKGVVRSALRNLVIHLVMEEQNRWFSNEIPKAKGHFWPEVLEALWHMAKDSGDVKQRESALLVLADVPLIFENQLERYLPEIQGLLQECMTDKTSLETQVAAVRAFIGFIIEMDQKEYRQYLQPMLPACFQVVLGACEDDENEPKVIECLAAIIELAEDKPKFFKPHMADVIATCHGITAHAELGDDTRRMAAEIVMELCESDSGMMRKFPECANLFIPVFLQFCTDLEDDPEWSKQDKDDVPDEEENHTVGEQMLDRMSIALGGAVVLPKAFEYIPAMLDSPRWQERAGGLTAIAAIAEGSLKEMKPELAMIVQNVVPRLLDEHPRVRYMACNAVGQMSLDFAPKPGKERESCFQTDFHASVIPNLLMLMQDSENPRVQAHGAAALVNFCERAHEEVLKPYLEDILTRLMEMLASHSRIVLEQTITCLATVADSSKKYFQRFYNDFMPYLKQILTTPMPDNDWRLLRGKTLECITFIGIAVSKEVFHEDAVEVMRYMAQVEEEGMDPDDPQITYMHAAWARICEVLGEDFVPYMAHVVDPLCRSLQLEPDIKILRPEDNVDDLAGGACAWEFGATGDNLRIGIKTAALEEKRTACEMLRLYVQQLRGHFGPYIEKVGHIVLGLLTFMLDEEVRSLAAALIPMLLTAAVENPKYGPMFAAQLWELFGPALLNAAKDETEIETQSYQIEAFNESIEVLGIECLSQTLMEKLTEILQIQLKFYDMRCEERKRTRLEDEDHDAEAEEKMTEEEEFENDNIRQVGDLLHTLFGRATTNFLPYFDELLPNIDSMLLPYPERTHFDHNLAISIFDDLIEYCGPKSFDYIDHFGEAMCMYLTHKDANLRQACAYGIGVCAMHGKDAYTPMVQSVLGTLYAMIADPESRSEVNRNATENAISAIVKIVIHMPAAGVTLEEALPQILDWLPILYDEEEAHYVYTELARKLADNNPVIIQPENLLKLFTIFAQVLGDKKLCPLRPENVAPDSDEFFVGEAVKSAMLSFSSANQDLAQAIVARIPDVAPDNLRSRLVAILN